MISSAEKFKAYLRDHLIPGFVFSLRARRQGVPDALLYRPIFSPWRGLPHFRQLYQEISSHTLISELAAWTLYSLARQAAHVGGDFLEAGVYQGGTALMLRKILVEANEDKDLHLFDTFAGMPDTRPDRDLHKAGDFSNTSVAAVSMLIGPSERVHFHPGIIPDTFSGVKLERIAFAHVDVDIHDAVYECCNFIYPRLTAGGIMVFDDYGFPSCPGARAAVDEFFADKPEVPLVLSSGQAVLFRSSSPRAATTTSTASS